IKTLETQLQLERKKVMEMEKRIAHSCAKGDQTLAASVAGSGRYLMGPELEMLKNYNEALRGQIATDKQTMRFLQSKSQGEVAQIAHLQRLVSMLKTVSTTTASKSTDKSQSLAFVKGARAAVMEDLPLYVLGSQNQSQVKETNAKLALELRYAVAEYNVLDAKLARAEMKLEKCEACLAAISAGEAAPLPLTGKHAHSSEDTEEIEVELLIEQNEGLVEQVHVLNAQLKAARLENVGSASDDVFEGPPLQKQVAALTKQLKMLRSTRAMASRRAAHSTSGAAPSTRIKVQRKTVVIKLNHGVPGCDDASGGDTEALKDQVGSLVAQISALKSQMALERAKDRGEREEEWRVSARRLAAAQDEEVKALRVRPPPAWL
ncbi:hypothetical protein CYMTET_32550, partial [Cymbomonas tetramitiformis]